MYRLRKNKLKYIKNRIKTQIQMANITGLDRSYISQIYNGRGVSKVGAFAITKAVSPDLEIIDLFENVEE